MEKYKELLKRFQAVPKLKANPPTFLEIAGYPHYENVCSNILAFFFDTSEQHNYGELFIRSLMDNVDVYSEADLSTLAVQREAMTLSGKRLDIIIETEDLVIGIENKIWAPLYNDLEDYSDFLETNYAGKSIVKIVLSLSPIPEEQLSAGFQNLTHYELLEQVKKGLGAYLMEGSNRFLFQLIDFIETMHNHTKANSMDQKVLKFFKEEKENIDSFLAQHNEIKRFLYDKVKEVQNIINERLEEENTELVKNKQWIWQKFALIHDFDFGNGLTVAVDANFEIDGIGIKVWVRRGSGNKLEILKSLSIQSSKHKIVGDQFWIQEKAEMDINTNNKEVAEKLLSVLKEIRMDINKEIQLN